MRGRFFLTSLTTDRVDASAVLSAGMRYRLRQQATTSVATPAMTVMGRRRAKTMGLIDDCMSGSPSPLDEPHRAARSPN